MRPPVSRESAPRTVIWQYLLPVTRRQRWDIAVLHSLSALMCGCNCSVAWSHMQHHRHAMGPSDIEGHCGHMSAGQVLRYGPRFPLDLIRACWGQGGPNGANGSCGTGSAWHCWPVLSCGAASGSCCCILRQRRRRNA